jgi:hypothetical protein
MNKIKEILAVVKSVFLMVAPTLKKADSQHGIKETSEMIVALNKVSLLLLSHFKEGAKLSNFIDLYAKINADKELQEAVKVAYEDYKLIPVEIKDADAGEALELAALQIEYVPQILEVLGKSDEA